MILPQDGVGGRTPTPRKLNVALRRTVVEMPRVAQTMMVDTRWGRMWRNRISPELAPSDRSATMNSRSDSELVSA